MATFCVEFIFCCPCFVSGVHDSIFLDLKFNYEYVVFYKWRNPRTKFEHEMFAGFCWWSFIVTCFAHLSEAMHHDNCTRLYHNRRIFYQLIVENEHFPRKKCYSCYKRSVKKLLKYFIRFVVSQQTWELIFWGLATMQFLLQKDLLTQQVMIFIWQKKLLCLLRVPPSCQV